MAHHCHTASQPSKANLCLERLHTASGPSLTIAGPSVEDWSPGLQLLLLHYAAAMAAFCKAMHKSPRPHQPVGRPWPLCIATPGSINPYRILPSFLTQDSLASWGPGCGTGVRLCSRRLQRSDAQAVNVQATPHVRMSRGKTLNTSCSMLNQQQHDLSSAESTGSTDCPGLPSYIPGVLSRWLHRLLYLADLAFPLHLAALYSLYSSLCHVAHDTAGLVCSARQTKWKGE